MIGLFERYARQPVDDLHCFAVPRRDEKLLKRDVLNGGFGDFAAVGEGDLGIVIGVQMVEYLFCEKLLDLFLVCGVDRGVDSPFAEAAFESELLLLEMIGWGLFAEGGADSLQFVVVLVCLFEDVLVESALFFVFEE